MTSSTNVGRLGDKYPWDGQILELREIVRVAECQAYRERFIRRAVVEGGADSFQALARWEGELAAKVKAQNRKQAQNWRSRFLVPPTKKNPKGWSYDKPHKRHGRD